MFPKSDEVYLDTAATSRKLTSVVDTLSRFYRHEVAPVHRSVYQSSHSATARFEASRDAVRELITAQDRSEIVFTKGTTEGINLIAATYGDMAVQEGDEILITEMEHHANIVPWKILADKKNAYLKVVPVLDDGTLDYKAYAAMLNPRVKIVAVAHVSNVLGTVNDVEWMYTQAKQVGATVVVDGAQAVPHLLVNVQSICDFYLFSSHKMYGPDGVGVLYGKKELLEAMPPYQTGGAMIEEVSFEKVTFQDPPWKFEAGTPSIGGVIALKDAIEFIQSLDFDKEQAKHRAFIKMIQEAIPDINVISSQNGVGIFSFTLPGTHPLDVATMLGLKNVSVRSGHMCAQPLLKRFGLPSILRVSFGAYTEEKDIHSFINALESVRTLVTA